MVAERVTSCLELLASIYFDNLLYVCETFAKTQHVSRLANSFPRTDHSKSTTTMTFRLDENVINTLRAESGRHKISLNAMINQILQRYVEWDMYESKVGLISFLRPVAVELFKKMSKQEIIELATSIGKNATNDAALFMKNKMDLDSFLSWLDVRMKNSQLKLVIVLKAVHIHIF